MDNIFTTAITVFTALVGTFTLMYQIIIHRNTKYLVKSKDAIKIYMIWNYQKLLEFEIFLYYLTNNLDKEHLKKNIRFFSSSLFFDTGDFANIFYEDKLAYQYFSQFKHGLEILNQTIVNFMNDLQNEECDDELINKYVFFISSKLEGLYLAWYSALIMRFTVENSNTLLKRGFFYISEKILSSKKSVSKNQNESKKIDKTEQFLFYVSHRKFEEYIFFLIKQMQYPPEEETKEKEKSKNKILKRIFDKYVVLTQRIIFSEIRELYNNQRKLKATDNVVIRIIANAANRYSIRYEKDFIEKLKEYEQKKPKVEWKHMILLYIINDKHRAKIKEILDKRLYAASEIIYSTKVSK